MYYRFLVREAIERLSIQVRIIIFTEDCERGEITFGGDG